MTFTITIKSGIDQDGTQILYQIDPDAQKIYTLVHERVINESDGAFVLGFLSYFACQT